MFLSFLLLIYESFLPEFFLLMNRIPLQCSQGLFVAQLCQLLFVLGINLLNMKLLRGLYFENGWTVFIGIGLLNLIKFINFYRTLLVNVLGKISILRP